MKKDYKVVRMLGASTGKCAVVKLYNLDVLIRNILDFNRTDQITLIDSGEESRSLCSLSKSEFLDIFSEKDIVEMKKSGRLSYCPNSRCSIHYKYPTFGAKIYEEYGVIKESK